MLDLSNIFNKDIKKAILSKEQLAEMLKVTPEALEAIPIGSKKSLSYARWKVFHGCFWKI